MAKRASKAESVEYNDVDSGDGGTIDPTEMLSKYEGFFEHLTRFTQVINQYEDSIKAASAVVEERKREYDEARDELKSLEEGRNGAKHSLYRFVAPLDGKFEHMPLFDSMADADESKHGKGSTEWRKEPIAALGISLPSLNSLAEADIVLIGQLQDMVLADPNEWYGEINGISKGAAAAIVDRLNDFIYQRTSR